MGINGLGAGFGSRLRANGVSLPFISISCAVLSNPAGPGCAEDKGQGFTLELSQLGAEEGRAHSDALAGLGCAAMDNRE